MSSDEEAFVVIEHEHASRGSGPGNAFVVGPAPIAAGSAGGPLSGLRLAVKDVLDVAGTRTGAGSPSYLAGARVATEHALAVRALVQAGAEVIGKTVVDELTFSLFGTNPHYGTPANPRAPGRMPGGSSSGSAVAVACGAADLALGTDTGGSIRVPASFCGLFGLRPTHGGVSIDGLVPLAPSFDTVGLFAPSASLLRAGFEALWHGAAGPAGPPRPVELPPATAIRAARLVLPEALWRLCDEPTREALAEAARSIAETLQATLEWSATPTDAELKEMLGDFRTIQLAEAWQTHGGWLAATRPPLGPGVASRFAEAALVAEQDVARARQRRQAASERLRRLLGVDALLVQPAATGPAPPLDIAAADKAELRRRMLVLTAPAGLAGLPVVVLPAATVDALPVGLAIGGQPGADAELLALAEAVC